MSRPLYQSLDLPNRRSGGNAGLWYDKFCDQWKPDWLGLGDDGKKEWIKTVTGKVGHQSQLEITNAGLADFLKAHNQQPLFFKNTYTFVTGLGREHPVENGFAWHHTLGVPYLPGSSVKGMVRAWAEQWDPKPDDEEINRIFGPKKGDLHVGSVIFLDALPTKPVKLQADIMTPHYGPYYQDDKGQTPPADWHSPTPIPFLAVSKEQSFVFGLLPRREKDKDDCQQVETWLKDALCWIGAGAKTAVGYGRFERDLETEQKFQDVIEQRRQEELAQQAEAQRQAKLKEQTQGKSKLYTELFLVSQNEGWYEKKEVFVGEGLIEHWLEKLEADPQSDAIHYLKELIEHHFPGLLENPAAKKGKKNKFVFKPRQRTVASRMLKLSERRFPNTDS